MDMDEQKTVPEQAADPKTPENKDEIRKPAEKAEKPHSVLKELQARQKIWVKKPKASEKDPDLEEEL